MTDIAAAAEILAAGMLMGEPYATGVGAVSLAEAFDIQDAVAQRISDPLGGRGGWKIAWNVPHLMEKFAMPHPGMGRLFNNQIHHGDTDTRLSEYQSLMIEPEIVARLAMDIPPGQTYDTANIAPFVAGFTVGFEVLDRRNSPDTATASGILAQNVFNAGAVIGGKWTHVDDLDTARITTRLFDGDTVVAEGAGLAPQNPLEAVAFLANHFTGRGETMKAGEIVMCGSHTPLYPVTSHTKLSLSMGLLGEVSLRIS